MPVSGTGSVLFRLPYLLSGRNEKSLRNLLKRKKNERGLCHFYKSRAEKEIMSYRDIDISRVDTALPPLSLIIITW